MDEIGAAVASLVTKCAGFDATWRRHLAQWREHGEPAGYYNDMAVVAKWIVERLKAGDLDCFPALFSEVEVLLVGASRELRDALVVGLLEDIQHLSTDRGVDPDLVLPFLGAESRKGWFELIKLWHGPDARGWPGQSHE